MKSTYFFLTSLVLVAPVRGFVSRWEVGRYGHCSTSCGRGVQTRTISCKETSRDINLPVKFCRPPKPPSTRSCAIISCTPEWSAQRWQECSKTCGRGFQYRELRCSQRLADGIITYVSDDYCPRGRPSNRRRCGVSDCPPRYSAKKWTACSVSCGGGVQFRQVHCTRIKAGAHVTQVVATDHCSHLVPPHRKRRCNQNMCSDVTTVLLTRRRAAKLRSFDSETYFRGRGTSKFRPSVDARQHSEQDLDGLTDLHWRARKSMISERRRVSRRRSITGGKATFYDCDDILGDGLNTSDIDLLIGCSIRLRNINDKLSPAARHYGAIPPGQNSQHSSRMVKYSQPYIVTRRDISPSLLPRSVLHVGGMLTISHTDTVTLLCEATGYPPPITQWMKDGDGVIENDRLAILRENSLQESSLRFIRPNRSDSGIYTCIARNAVGSSRVDTTLNVVTRPEILPLEANDLDLRSSVHTPIGSVIRARSGVAIRISCPVEGFPPPRIRWHKDVTGLGDNVRILPDDSLEIYPATPVDQGLYSCEATNPVGTDYRTSTLLLFEPPHLQEYLSLTDTPRLTQMGLPRLLLAKEDTPIYTLDLNGSALIGCPVAGGQKDIQVMWQFANQPIDRSRIRFHTLVDGMVLFLEAVDADSVGVYSCRTHSEAGSLTATLEVRLARYSFVLAGLSECSHSCGGSGVRHVTLNCLREGKVPVAEWYCVGLKRPEIQAKPCNRVDCPPKFRVGTWGTCSRTCGMGERSRRVSCVQLQADNNFREVSTSICTNQLSPGFESDVDMLKNSLPISKEPCILSPCPSWRTGSWSTCGEKCYSLGIGLRVRRLYCVDANGTSVSRMECSPVSRPNWRELCYTKKCDPVWVVSKWSSCSRTCGDAGIQTRILNCVFRGNRRQRARNLCENSLRPRVSMPCGRVPC